jgi:hypothetical protein
VRTAIQGFQGDLDDFLGVKNWECHAATAPARL